MAAATDPGLVDAIKIDLRRMHETWMELRYPRQREASGTVLGKWTPDEGLQAHIYTLWSWLGVPVVGLLYPLVLFGYFVRFQTRRVNVTALRIGALGVIGIFVLLWGALTLVAFDRYGLDSWGFVAVAASSGVAVVSAALSFLFWRIDGRFTTVIFAYPFAMTAIFLPPVVAALFSELVASVIFPRTDTVHFWLIDNTPSAFESVKNYLIDQYDLKGAMYVALWFGISVPVGWLLGIVVTLADLIRPSSE